MPEYEHSPSSPEAHLSIEEQERLSHEGHERIQEAHESNLERSKVESRESAKHEVEKAFEKNEKEHGDLENSRNTLEKKTKQRPTGRTAKEANFKRVMNEVQPQLNVPSRTFSKFIHNPVIEKTSETVGKTIARPDAILSGAVFAFVLTLAVYLIGRYFGYPLSGFESIGAFILGWVVGILYDFLHVMITGKQA